MYRQHVAAKGAHRMSMKRADWLLLALAQGKGDPLTPVQLQKVLFLLGRERRAAAGRAFYKFVPYNYGPFCRDIYTDAEALEADGLVRIDRAEPGRAWPEYSATAAGLRRSVQLKKSAPPDGAQYLARVVDWARGLNFQQLVKAIYDRYPDQKINSVFRYRSR